VVFDQHRSGNVR